MNITDTIIKVITGRLEDLAADPETYELDHVVRLEDDLITQYLCEAGLTEARAAVVIERDADELSIDVLAPTHKEAFTIRPGPTDADVIKILNP